jgi:hypothetical protein
LRRGSDVLLLPNAGDCVHRSLDAKSATTRRICAMLYNLSRRGVTEGRCPQAFSDVATTPRANDVPRKRHSDLKLRQRLPGNRALLATNCGNDQEAKL